MDPDLCRHKVEVARDVFEAAHRIERAAGRPYDLILCDVARNDVPGPELWAYLSLVRRDAARRMVFVASAPLPIEAKAFLARVPNLCIELPVDNEAFDALARRRAAVDGRSTWAGKLSSPSDGRDP
jgi:hypothetical protein